MLLCHLLLPGLLLQAAPPPVPCEALLEEPARPAALAAGAERCRAAEPVLAFALSQRALALAPEAADAQLAHARSLLALGQRGEAAALLERALSGEASRDGALRAGSPQAAALRLLRAELALAEAEPGRALALLAPLAHHPRARALRAQARAELQRRERAQQALAAQARAQGAREREAAAFVARELEDAPVRPGLEAWGARGGVERGGQRTFRLRHVRAGHTYVLLATGQCHLPQGAKRQRRHAPTPRELFGVDFRARVGALEAWPLRVGLEPQRSAYTFRAPEDDPQLFVEDRSAPSSTGGVRCSVRDLAVRVP